MKARFPAVVVPIAAGTVWRCGSATASECDREAVIPPLHVRTTAEVTTFTSAGGVTAEVMDTGTPTPYVYPNSDLVDGVGMTGDLVLEPTCQPVEKEQRTGVARPSRP